MTTFRISIALQVRGQVANCDLAFPASIASRKPRKKGSRTVEHRYRNHKWIICQWSGRVGLLHWNKSNTTTPLGMAWNDASNNPRRGKVWRTPSKNLYDWLRLNLADKALQFAQRCLRCQCEKYNDSFIHPLSTIWSRTLCLDTANSSTAPTPALSANSASVPPIDPTTTVTILTTSTTSPTERMCNLGCMEKNHP